MLNWQRGYRALDIKHLRSPEGLHPDPYDHSALAVYAKQVKLEEDGFVEMTQLGRGDTVTHGKGHGARDQGVWCWASATYCGQNSVSTLWVASRANILYII